MTAHTTPMTREEWIARTVARAPADTAARLAEAISRASRQLAAPRAATAAVTPHR